MSETLQHLVLVRHGESEGDIRRAAWKRGDTFSTDKLPEQEELTERGIEQCRRAGLWVIKNIIRQYGLPGFDMCLVSSALRSEQSAMAMELNGAVWQEDHCLDERDRGYIRGLRKEQHERVYPESYNQMKTDPLHWTPPGGNAIVPDIVGQVRQFLANIEGARAVIAVTHRDWMWAAMQPLESLNDTDLSKVNTEHIHNAQIIHYTSISPTGGDELPELAWVYSVDPCQPKSSIEWRTIIRPSANIAFAGESQK